MDKARRANDCRRTCRGSRRRIASAIYEKSLRHTCSALMMYCIVYRVMTERAVWFCGLCGSVGGLGGEELVTATHIIS